MKRWMQIALVMSLSFNFGFLGAYIFRMMEKPSVEQMHTSSPIEHQEVSQPIHQPPQPFMEKPVLQPEQRRKLHEIRQTFQPKIQKVRQALMREKRAFGDMLFNGESDSAKIDMQIQRIGELEMRMEKEIIFELLREAQILAPEERAPFIRMALKRIEGNKQRQQSPKNRLSKQGMRPQSNPNRPKQRRNQP